MAKKPAVVIHIDPDRALRRDDWLSHITNATSIDPNHGQSFMHHPPEFMYARRSPATDWAIVFVSVVFATVLVTMLYLMFHPFH